MSAEATDAVPPVLLDNPDPADQTAGVVAAGRQRETYMGFARTLATFVFILALPFALVATNVRLLANAPVVYDYSFDRYSAEDATGLTRADLNSTARALRQYFNDDEKTFYHTVTESGLPGPVFSARETRHMEDVKQLFVWVNRLQELSVVFVLAYVVAFFLWARDGDVRQLATQSLIGLGLGTIAVGAFAAGAVFGFDATSTRFHEILFSNDFWLLDPNKDHLIQMFPEEFWRDVTLILAGMCALEAALIGAFAAVYLMSTRGARRRLTAAIDVNASHTQAA